jgi:1-acyl-sn-glycerol-3-phosphate acyltransferase
MPLLRLLLIILALLGSFVVAAPVQWGIVRWVPRFADRLPRLFCRIILALTKVEVVVSGTRVESGPVLVAANHVSWIDILALCSVHPFCFLAKSEVSRWPIVSGLARVQGTVFVDRSRRRLIPRANRDMAERLREGRSVLLFPEGTTVGAEGPAQFHTSHFAAARDLLRLDASAAVVVQPVAIGFSSDAAAWVGDDNLVSHILRTLRSPPLRCFVSFGEPIAYALDSNRKTVAKLCREAIVEMLTARSTKARQGACDAAISPASFSRPDPR